MLAKLRHALPHRHSGPGLPALDHELPVDTVECRHHALPGETPEQRKGRGGSDDDLVGAGVQPACGRVEVPDSAPHPAGSDVEQRLDERTIGSLPSSRVEIDHCHLSARPN